MASATSAAASALLLVVLALFSAPAAARPGIPFHPCNTVFITYTISTTTTTSSLSGDDSASAPRYTTGFVSIYRVVTPFRLSASDAGHRRPDAAFPRREEIARPAEDPVFGFSSLQERAKDILVVVVGLLFGVGCGALTATTMYLVWSFVTNRHEFCDAYEDEEEDVESLKKAGYIKIPATTEPAAAIPAKEG